MARNLLRLSAILVAFGIPATAPAQTAEELVAEAIIPLPDHQKDDATVVRYEADGRRTVLRQGSNAMVCEPDAPAPGVRVWCYDESFVPRMNEVAKLRARGERNALVVVDAAHAAGTVPNANMGSLMRFWSGPDRQHARRMTIIWVPGATGDSTGLPIEPSAGRAWLMCPAGPRAHIMVGATPYGIPEDAWKRCLP